VNSIILWTTQNDEDIEISIDSNEGDDEISMEQFQLAKKNLNSLLTMPPSFQKSVDRQTMTNQLECHRSHGVIIVLLAQILFMSGILSCSARPIGFDFTSLRKERKTGWNLYDNEVSQVIQDVIDSNDSTENMVFNLIFGDEWETGRLFIISRLARILDNFDTQPQLIKKNPRLKVNHVR